MFSYLSVGESIYDYEKTKQKANPCETYAFWKPAKLEDFDWFIDARSLTKNYTSDSK